MRALLLLSLLPLTYGCSDECKAPTDLRGGVMEATIDGQAWSTLVASWSETGSSLNINVDRTDGYTISMVLQTIMDGRNVLDLLDQDELPFDVTLGDGEDGGWAVVYVEGESGSYSTTEGVGGSITIAEREGDQLLGCLYFGAGSNAGETVDLADGLFRVAPRD